MSQKPTPVSELDEQMRKVEGRARLELAFRQAEASATHEFGDHYDAGDEYWESRRQIIAGELTFEEAEAIDLGRIRRRNAPAST